MGTKKKDRPDEISCQVCGANKRGDRIVYFVFDHLEFTSGISAKPQLPLCRNCQGKVEDGDVDPKRYLGSPTRVIGEFEMRRADTRYKPKNVVAAHKSDDQRPVVDNMFMRRLEQNALKVDASVGGMDELRRRNRGY